MPPKQGSQTVLQFRNNLTLFSTSMTAWYGERDLESNKYGSVEKFCTLVPFSVLFKNTSVPPRRL